MEVIGKEESKDGKEESKDGFPALHSGLRAVRQEGVMKPRFSSTTYLMKPSESKGVRKVRKPNQSKSAKDTLSLQGVRQEALTRGKRPTTVSKETYYSVKRDLLQRQEALTRGKRQEASAAAVRNERQRDEGMEQTFLGQGFKVKHEMHMETSFDALLRENSTAMMMSGSSDPAYHHVHKSREDMDNRVDAAVPFMPAAAAKGLALSRVAAWDSAHGTTNPPTHGTTNLGTPAQSTHEKGHGVLDNDMLDNDVLDITRHWHNVNSTGVDNGVNSAAMEEAATKLATKLANTHVHTATKHKHKLANTLHTLHTLHTPVQKATKLANTLANTLVHQAHESAAAVAIRPTGPYELLRTLMGTLTGAAVMHMPQTELVRKKKPHLRLPKALHQVNRCDLWGCDTVWEPEALEDAAPLEQGPHEQFPAATPHHHVALRKVGTGASSPSPLEASTGAHIYRQAFGDMSGKLGGDEWGPRGAPQVLNPKP